MCGDRNILIATAKKIVMCGEKEVSIIFYNLIRNATINLPQYFGQFKCNGIYMETRRGYWLGAPAF